MMLLVLFVCAVSGVSMVVGSGVLEICCVPGGDGGVVVVGVVCFYVGYYCRRCYCRWCLMWCHCDY